jgi:hypothetical protein
MRARQEIALAVYGTVLGLQANLKETSIVKIACQVEATRIRSFS